MARRKILLWLTPLLLLQQVPNFAVQRRYMSELHVGEKVSGVVSHVTGTLALVDVGVEKEGVLPISKMASGISTEVAVGEEVEVWVSQVKNEENLRHSSLVLSSDSQKVFSPSEPEMLKAFQELEPGTWLKGFVVAKRPFGFLVSVAPPQTEGRGGRGVGARAVGVAYWKEVEGAPHVGSEVKVKIVNLDLEKQRLSLSMKDATPSRYAAMEPFQTSKELRGQVLAHGKFGVFVAVKPSEDAHVTVGLLPKASVKRPEKLEQLKPGQELEGVVVRTSPEMTLVDLGFKQRGLLPPAKMAADTAVHVGDRLQVWVSELRPKSLATNPKKVLSLKSLGPAASLKDYAINSWYTGIVLRLSPFGAFVAVKNGSNGWAEGLVKTNQIQGDDLEVAAEVKVRVQDVDLRQKRIALSMRSEETARKSVRFAMLQNLTHEILAARIIAVEENGADVEVRHPETGSVIGWLSNSQVKRSKPLQVGEDIEVTILDIDVERYKLSLSMTQMPRGFHHQDFASLLADELGEGALDMLREGDEVQVRAQVSNRGLELSIV